MKLYVSAGSPFARKIRVMLIEKNAPHEVEMVDLFAANDLKQVNPLGKVPALKLDDGRVLVNSPLIADYVDGRFPGAALHPGGPGRAPGRAALGGARRRHHGRGGGELLRGALPRRGRSAAAHGSSASAASSTRASPRSSGCSTARPWCVGGAMSLADIALACNIGFINARRPEFFPQEKYPGLTKLWKKLEERESFRKTVPPPA